MLGEYLSQELPLAPSYNPKNVAGLVKKMSKSFLSNFGKRPIKPLGKIFRAQKTEYKNLVHFLDVLGAGPVMESRMDCN